MFRGRRELPEGSRAPRGREPARARGWSDVKPREELQDCPFSGDDRDGIVGAINSAVGLGGRPARAVPA
eukprot:7486665-Pyramimonas_sp.AAC.1